VAQQFPDRLGRLAGDQLDMAQRKPAVDVEICRQLRANARAVAWPAATPSGG
jgi:hypothetical protein